MDARSRAGQIAKLNLVRPLKLCTFFSRDTPPINCLASFSVYEHIVNPGVLTRSLFTTYAMHEIVTLQFGERSNYLGTHYWNTQVRRQPYSSLSLTHAMLWFTIHIAKPHCMSALSRFVGCLRTINSVAVEPFAYHALHLTVHQNYSSISPPRNGFTDFDIRNHTSLIPQSPNRLSTMISHSGLALLPTALILSHQEHCSMT
jgi:hypothetical protein